MEKDKDVEERPFGDLPTTKVSIVTLCLGHHHALIGNERM